MWLLILVVWWTAPLVMVAGLLAHYWLEGRRVRRFERDVEVNSGRLRGMHERHVVSVLRPNGSVENVIPSESRRRDGGVA